MKISPHRLYYLLFTVTGVALCFVPLFNIIGYESAAFFGVLGGLVASFLPLHVGQISNLFPAIVKNVKGLFFPFLILTLNALRVPNCDFFTGTLFWIFIPMFSIAFGTSIAFLAYFLFRSRWKRFLFVFILIVFSFGVFAFRLAFEPPITGHQLFLGYFSGSIYDEALRLPMSLVYYRILGVLLFASVFALIGFLQRRTRGRLWILISLVIFALLGFYFRADVGIDLSREFIEEELGGYAESEHFKIYYPAREPYKSDITRIIEDHEFRYAEHQHFFQTDPVQTYNKKIKSFIYGSRNEKGRLLGARRTQVAKLWLHEIHIMWKYYGDHMLAHELAHVFTEPFGNGPLRLSAKYGVLGINMGIVEGAATAADWNAPDLDPHHISAALRRLKKAPSLENLLSASGFWTQYSGRVYTLMGSFFKFLIDKYGIDTFKKAYPEGALEYAYEKPLGELIKEWETFLDAIVLTENELDVAKYRYDRKSIFQKVCARKIADLRVEAARFSNHGNVEKAMDVYEHILRFDPTNNEYKIEFIRFLAASGKNKRALKALDTLSPEELSPAQIGQVEALRGDLAWKENDLDVAKLAYGNCLQHGLPLGFARSIEVKKKTLENASLEAQELGFQYLVNHEYDSISLYFPSTWVANHPEDPLAHYLLARRLRSGRLWKTALKHAREAKGSLYSERLENENMLVMMECLMALKSYSEIETLADRLSKSSLNHYQILGVEYLNRIHQKNGNSLTGEKR